MDTEDSSVADDSDADPWWSPGSDNYVSEAEGSSPMTKEQARVSIEAESLLQDWEVPQTAEMNISESATAKTVLTETPATEEYDKKCYCGTLSVMIPVKEGKDKGRIFLTCDKPPENRCHFFQWLDESDIQPMSQVGEDSTTGLPVQENDKYKRYFCVFCSSLVHHFPRHLLTKHKDEEEVVKVASLKVGSVERKKMIAIIRGRGSLIFNSNNDLNKGNLISARRSKQLKNETNFKPCVKCYNFYSKSSLWKHYRICTGEKQVPRDLQAKSSVLNITSNAQLSERMKNDILPAMTKDKVYKYLLQDEVILNFGNYLCSRHKLDRHLTNMIRTKLRQLAKLTLAMKDVNQEIKNLDTSLSPEHYDTFVSAVNNVAGFDGNQYKSPSLVGELGRSMKLVANRRIIDYIKFNNNKRKKDIEKWLHIFNYDYYHSVGKSALISIQRRKHGKVELIPLIKDVMKVKEHVDQQIKWTEETLRDGFDMQAFDTLNKCVMSQIQIFNRKRAGEIEMFTLNEFERRHSIDQESDIYKSLQTAEKLSAGRYVRVESRGKLNLRPASFLLTLKQTELIKLLITHRKAAGINESNPYVFAKKTKFYSACKSLSEMAYSSNAKHPDLITGTWLRKQIATTAQALSFTENEMTNLAGFLGHDIKTHRQFYRLPSDAIHLAKISKLLKAMDDGSINKFFGKTLDEIHINLNTVDDVDDINLSCKTNTPVKEIDVAQEEDVHDLQFDENELTKKRKYSSNQASNRKKELLKRVHCNKTPPSKIKNIKHTWKTPERQATRKLFKEYIYSIDNKLPTPMECRTAIQTNQELHGLTIGQIKGWVYSEKRRVQRDGT